MRPSDTEMGQSMFSCVSVRQAAGCAALIAVLAAGCGPASKKSAKDAAVAKAVANVQQRATNGRIDFGKTLRSEDVHDRGDVLKIAHRFFRKFTIYGRVGTQTPKELGHSVHDGVVSIDVVFSAGGFDDSAIYRQRGRAGLCVSFTVDPASEPIHVRVQDIDCPLEKAGRTAAEVFDRVVHFDRSLSASPTPGTFH